MKFSDRMGKRIMREGRDWDPSMPDTEVALNYEDNLDLVFAQQNRAMKEDSITAAINTDFFSKVDSLNSAKSTRHNPAKTRRADRNKTFKWERLDDVKMSITFICLSGGCCMCLAKSLKEL